MSKTKKHILLKIMSALVVVVLAVGGSGLLWFTSHYKGIIKAKLPGLVSRATDSLYHISVQDISINVLTGRIRITGIKLWADTVRMAAYYRQGRAPHSYYTIAIPAVEARGIQWANLAASKELRLGRLAVYHPEITITTPPADSLHPQHPAENEHTALELVAIQNIDITDPVVSYRNGMVTGDTGIFRMHGGHITMKDWVLDPQQPADEEHFLHAAHTAFQLDSFSFHRQSGLYDVTLAHARFSTDSSRLALQGLEVKSNVAHEQFYKTVGHQKDIFHILFRNILLEQLDWKRLQRDRVLAARSVMLDDALIDIFFSRLPPPNNESKMGNFPNQLLLKLKLKLDIAGMDIRNGRFKYTELNEDTKLPGVLLFDDISGHIDNITNIGEAIAADNSCVVQLQGKFMKRSPMHAVFHFALDDKDGAFSVDGGMTDLDAPQINNAAKALAKAEIKSLHVNKLDLHVTGNQYAVKSNVLILYKDLEVALKKVDEPQQLKATPVLSFLANNVLLYTDNPMPGEAVRKVSPVVKRNPYKSFFSQIWRCIFNGAQQTAIKSDNIEKALEAKQADKTKPEAKKKSFLQHLFGGGK